MKEETAEEEAPAVQPEYSARMGVFKLHIGEGKDINLEIPVGIMGGSAVAAPAPVAVAGAPAAEEKEARVMGTLTRKHFKNPLKERTGDNRAEQCFTSVKESKKKQLQARNW